MINNKQAILIYNNIKTQDNTLKNKVIINKNLIINH